MEGVEGLIHVSEMDVEEGQSPEEAYPAGAEITVKILNIDSEERKVSLSMKAAKEGASAPPYTNYMNNDTGGGTLGDILGESLAAAKSEEEQPAEDVDEPEGQEEEPAEEMETAAEEVEEETALETEAAEEEVAEEETEAADADAKEEAEPEPEPEALETEDADPADEEEAPEVEGSSEQADPEEEKND
jgi:small subunit ribosomal protein S1